MTALVPPMSGRLMQLVALTGVLVLGCVKEQVPSHSYRVKIPVLTASPNIINCKDGPCELWLSKDIQAIVRELKAACLAFGQTPEECQTK